MSAIARNAIGNVILFRYKEINCGNPDYCVARDCKKFQRRDRMAMDNESENPSPEDWREVRLTIAELEAKIRELRTLIQNMSTD